MVHKHRHLLSLEIKDLKKSLNGEVTPLGDLLQILEARGHPLLILILTLPFFLPIPVPGLSIAFGLIISIASICYMFDKPIWLPKWMASKTIKRSTAEKTLDLGSKIVSKLEKISYPRGKWFHNNPLIKITNCSLIIILAFVLALPLPPGTNFPPALAIFSFAIAFLEEDILFVFLGYFFFIINIIVFTLLYLFGVEVFQYIYAAIS